MSTDEDARGRHNTSKIKNNQNLFEITYSYIIKHSKTNKKKKKVFSKRILLRNKILFKNMQNTVLNIFEKKYSEYYPCLEQESKP